MDKFDSKGFRRRLFSLRRQAQLSQEALATEIGVAQSTVKDWENGYTTPNTKRLLLLSNYFRVSCDYLVTGKHTRIFQ